MGEVVQLSDHTDQAPEIEGAKLMKTSCGEDRIWILNSKTAEKTLAEKGIEIGGLYRLMVGNEDGHRVKIDGISKDLSGFNEETTQEEIGTLDNDNIGVFGTFIDKDRGTIWIGSIGDIIKEDNGFSDNTDSEKPLHYNKIDPSELEYIGGTMREKVVSII